MNNTITLRHLTRNSTHVIPQNGDRKLISWPYRFCDVISPYVFPITTTGTAFRLELTTLSRALDAVNNTASRLRRTGMQSPQHRSSACAHYSLHKPPSGLPYTTPLDSGSGTAAQTAVAEAGHDGGWLQDCVTTGTRLLSVPHETIRTTPATGRIDTAAGYWSEKRGVAKKHFTGCPKKLAQV